MTKLYDEVGEYFINMDTEIRKYFYPIWTHAVFWKRAVRKLLGGQCQVTDKWEIHVFLSFFISRKLSCSWFWSHWNFQLPQQKWKPENKRWPFVVKEVQAHISSSVICHFMWDVNLDARRRWFSQVVCLTLYKQSNLLHFSLANGLGYVYISTFSVGAVK